MKFHVFHGSVFYPQVNTDDAGFLRGRAGRKSQVAGRESTSLRGELCAFV